jgi:hypothetical protein
MKKIIYSLTLTLCLMLSVCCFAGCTDGHTVDPNSLIGVWEVSDEGGYSYITRIEFKESKAGIEGQGSYTYYIDNGSVPYSGTWGSNGADSSKEFMLLPDPTDETLRETTQLATLAEGRLYIQYNHSTTITYRKVRD